MSGLAIFAISIWMRFFENKNDLILLGITTVIYILNYFFMPHVDFVSTSFLCLTVLVLQNAYYLSIFLQTKRIDKREYIFVNAVFLFSSWEVSLLLLILGMNFYKLKLNNSFKILIVSFLFINLSLEGFLSEPTLNAIIGGSSLLYVLYKNLKIRLEDFVLVGIILFSIGGVDPLVSCSLGLSVIFLILNGYVFRDKVKQTNYDMLNRWILLSREANVKKQTERIISSTKRNYSTNFFLTRTKFSNELNLIPINIIVIFFLAIIYLMELV